MKRRLPKSEFSRNVLTLMTGTTIAQAIPIAIMPILTRLYTPEDFGVLALFIAVTMVLGSVATGRYELAIMLPEKDEDAINIAALGLLIAFIFSIVLLLPIILFNSAIVRLLGSQEIGFWLYFIPFVVFIMGAYNVLNYLNTRKKMYKNIAMANVYKSSALAFVQLGFGYIKSGAMGLVSGQIIAQVIASCRLAQNIKKNYDIKVSCDEVKLLAKRYVDFPKISMWAILANNLSNHLTSILISLFFSIATLGSYSLAQKILGFPSALLGTSISQVFFQEAMKEKLATGKVIESFDRTLKKLIMLSLPIFLLLFVVVEDVFAFAFGENWRVSGTYAMYLIPVFATRFIVGAVTPVDTIMEKQKYFLYFNLVLLSLSMIVIFLTKAWEFTSFLMALSASVSIVYVVYGFMLRRMANNEL